MLRLFALLVLFAISSGFPAAHAQSMAVEVVDIAGRAVKLDRPANRIVLGHWVTLDALSLLHDDPVSLLAGWGDGGANTYQGDLLRERFPEIDAVPVVANGSLDQMSVEAVLALDPDLVILSRFDAFRFGDAGAAPPHLAQLEEGGIPVVIVDFFIDPIANTVPSLRIIGKLTGKVAEADAFAQFYEARLRTLALALDGAGAPLKRPSIFLHAFANRQECCFSAGRGALDGLISLAGGTNIGSESLPGAIGQLSLEAVIVRDPDIYLPTAVNEAGLGLSLGPGVSRQRATEGLESILARRELSAIAAVKHRRVFAMWHLFTHTPLHIVALEALAKHLHPQRFAEADAQATLDEINRRFLSVPLQGTFWIAGGDTVENEPGRMPRPAPVISP